MFDWLRNLIAENPRGAWTVCYVLPAVACLLVFVWLHVGEVERENASRRSAKQSEADPFDPVAALGMAVAAAIWPAVLFAAAVYLTGRVLWRLGSVPAQKTYGSERTESPHPFTPPGPKEHL